MASPMSIMPSPFISTFAGAGGESCSQYKPICVASEMST